MGDLPGGALGGLRGGALDGHRGQRPNLLMVWVKAGCGGLDFILGPLQFGENSFSSNQFDLVWFHKKNSLFGF